MTMRKFIEKSGSKKYKGYSSYSEFLSDYRDLAKTQMLRRKNETSEKKRLNFDLSFNPEHIEKWKLAAFKDQWKNLNS